MHDFSVEIGFVILGGRYVLFEKNTQKGERR